MNNQKKIEDNNKFWDVKRAGERLLWRFGLDKPFLPNEDDKLALKSVLAWINRQSSGVIENNPLFAKLFLLQLIMIRYYSLDPEEARLSYRRSPLYYQKCKYKVKKTYQNIIIIR